MTLAKKSIMIFGAGELQESIIKTANAMDLETIVIDPNPNAIAKQYANKFYCIAGNDYEGTLEIAKKHKVKGIVTSATDKPLIMMAKIAEKLNLSFPAVESIKNSIDKYKFKKILMKNNLPCAKGFLISNYQEALNLLNKQELEFPVILKPIDNSGSRGVFFCDNIAAVTENFSETFKETKSPKILIEDYIEGDEISIEAVVQNKKVQIIQVTDKKTTEFPYNVEIQHLQPSKYKVSHYNIIQKILQKTVGALGLDNCALHPEMKINNNLVKIIEMGPRLGGDYITSDLVTLSTGVNIEELLLKIAIGKKISYQIQERASMIKYFNLQPNTILEKIPDEITEMSSTIHNSRFDLKIGEKVPKITNSLNRYGFVIYK